MKKQRRKINLENAGLVSIRVTEIGDYVMDTFKYNREDKKLEKKIAKILFFKHNINLCHHEEGEVEKKDIGFFDS